MTFDGAVVKEQGVTFAIVVVEQLLLKYTNRQMEEVRSRFASYFSNIPVIFMTHNVKGRPMYHGRTDIVVLLVGMDFRKIPWKRYSMIDLSTESLSSL